MNQEINTQLKEIKKKYPVKVAYTLKSSVAIIDRQGFHRFRDDYKPLAYVIPVKLNTCAIREARITKKRKKLEELQKVSSIILQCFNFIGYKKGVKYIKGFKSITK